MEIIIEINISIIYVIYINVMWFQNCKNYKPSQFKLIITITVSFILIPGVSYVLVLYIKETISIFKFL